MNRRFKSPLLLAFVAAYVIAGSFIGVASQLSSEDCPLLCDCNLLNNNLVNVTCVEFPKRFPDYTRNLRFENTSIDIISINSFLRLKHLYSINFSNITIGTIQACSFAELGNLTAIVFQGCKINLLQGNAFSNLFNISRIKFSHSSINEISSHAFQNLSYIDDIIFENTQIVTIHPFAFRMISHVQHLHISHSNITTLLKSGFVVIDHVMNVSIVGNHFEAVYCDNIDFLLENVTFPLVRNNTFNCTCFLTWLWTSTGNRTTVMRSTPELGNTCVEKGNLANVRIDSVCPDASQRNKSCTPLLPSPPHVCSSNDDSLRPLTQLPYPTSTKLTPTNSASALIDSLACLLFVAAGALFVILTV
ncbi:slit homolog 1 protein-like [Dreissena polymorpha]|uniref:Uncharacterized protein n=1 Tax=Dreissena polymorpha TaxID=45954 RepID=A0A9D4CB34_DREPO|nr:slit homolog 1 protein-like [Dreissena polymorpha]XP_052247934.1 slit homolog 1 protein-like [Dreissena polymorpha]XP_052247935.1 slit homolog 1 protein-like [Dreissena polymorpha]KAH3720833.1 hypothetical protein DPMN_063739 [Dreissena polymorpha]